MDRSASGSTPFRSRAAPYIRSARAPFSPARTLWRRCKATAGITDRGVPGDRARARGWEAEGTSQSRGKASPRTPGSGGTRTRHTGRETGSARASPAFLKALAGYPLISGWLRERQGVSSQRFSRHRYGEGSRLTHGHLLRGVVPPRARRPDRCAGPTARRVPPGRSGELLFLTCIQSVSCNAREPLAAGRRTWNGNSTS